MANNYKWSNSVLSQYELKQRSNPEKYLYDALDAYYSLFVKNSENKSTEDLLLDKVWAANDVENTAKGLELIGEDFDKEIEEFKESLDVPKDNFEKQLNQMRIATLKIRLIIAAMKSERPKNVKLKA